jgi:hypothetical protein
VTDRFDFAITALAHLNASTASTIGEEDIPAVLTAIALEHARLGDVERVLLARLVGARRDPGDHCLTLEEAAEVLRMTPDYLKRHGRKLGLAVEHTPGQIRYSAQAIQDYLRTRRGAEK